MKNINRRHFAAASYVVIGLAVPILVVLIWALDGVPDGWLDRIVQPVLALLSPVYANTGVRWLRALRKDPYAPKPREPRR